jgi:hypothetical protein
MHGLFRATVFAGIAISVSAHSISSSYGGNGNYATAVSEVQTVTVASK